MSVISFPAIRLRADSPHPTSVMLRRDVGAWSVWSISGDSRCLVASGPFEAMLDRSSDFATRRGLDAVEISDPLPRAFSPFGGAA